MIRCGGGVIPRLEQLEKCRNINQKDNNWGQARRLAKNREFSFSHATFEIPLRHQSGVR